MTPRTSLGRLAVGLLLLLCLGSWIVILVNCKATFEPLTADDDTAGDDDSAGDDDGGDDDGADDDSGPPPIYSTGPLDTADGTVHTLFLLGAASGDPPIEARYLHDNLIAPTAGQPHVRYVHAAASAGPVDIYVEQVLQPDLSAFMPGATSPHPVNVGYGTIGGGAAGTYMIDVYPVGATYGDGTALCDSFIATYNEDLFYSVVVTGSAPDSWTCTRIIDSLGPVSAGNGRINTFHSIEDTLAIEVIMTSPTEITLWPKIDQQSASTAWEIPHDEIEMDIFSVP